MKEQDPPPPRAPALVPYFLVWIAGQILPGGSRRDRYCEEFLAELYGMTPGRQTVHALQLVASSWSLRAATADPHREKRTMLMIVRTKPLLCLLNARHDWQEESTSDGDRYLRCTKCGKDRMPLTLGWDPDGRNIGGR